MLLVVGEDAGSVADAAALGHVLDGHGHGLLEGIVTLGDDDRPHDLLIEDIGAAHGTDLESDDLGALGDVETGSLGDDGSVLAHESGVGLAVDEQDFPELVHVLGLVEDHDAFPAHGVEESLLLLGGMQQHVVAVAEDAVVAADSGNGHLHGVGEVIAAVENHRGVAGAHAVGGSAAGVGGLGETESAGSQDQVALGHQLGGMLQGGFLDRLHQVGGSAVGNQGLAHQVDGVGGSLLGTGSGADDEGVLALQGVHEVAERRDGGVGGRGDGADDADGVGDLHDAGDGVLADDAHRLLILQVGPEGGGSVGVLRDLVLIAAEAGLVHGFAGQGLGVLVDDLGDLVDQLIDLLLGVILDGSLRDPRGNDLFLNGHGFAPFKASYFSFPSVRRIGGSHAADRGCKPRKEGVIGIWLRRYRPWSAGRRSPGPRALWGCWEWTYSGRRPPPGPGSRRGR